MSCGKVRGEAKARCGAAPVEDDGGEALGREREDVVRDAVNLGDDHLVVLGELGGDLSRGGREARVRVRREAREV